MGELRVKGIRELRLGLVDWGMRCNICRLENISTGAAIAKRVKSSLEYVSAPVVKDGERKAYI
jgi:hypothetical protein